MKFDERVQCGSGSISIQLDLGVIPKNCFSLPLFSFLAKATEDIPAIMVLFCRVYQLGQNMKTVVTLKYFGD